MKLLRWTSVLALAHCRCQPASPRARSRRTLPPRRTGLPRPTRSDLETFWAEQRRVRVLQRRLYQTDNEFQLTLYVGAIPNDPFLNYYPIGGRFGYHITESIAVELSGAYNIDAEDRSRQLPQRERRRHGLPP